VAPESGGIRPVLATWVREAFIVPAFAGSDDEDEPMRILGEYLEWRRLAWNGLTFPEDDSP
jgi:hypothetical protein